MRFESRENVLRALDLALQLASVNGALAWHLIAAGFNGALRDEHVWKVSAMLTEFLHFEEN